MQPLITTSAFIYIITVILSCIAGLVLLIYSKEKMVNNRWLAGYYLAAGYGYLIAFLLFSKLINNPPWFYTYRTGYIAGFLLMPLSYMYIRSLIQQKKFSPIDLLHFLPATIFIIDFIPYYFQPADYKLQQLMIDEQQLNTLWAQFSQGWLGIGNIYMPLRIGLATLYWILQARIILRSKKLKTGENLVAENKAIIIWAKIFCSLQAMYFLPYYIIAIIGSRNEFFFAQHAMAALGVSTTIFILVLRPDILYGLKGAALTNDGTEPADGKAGEDIQAGQNVFDKLSVHLIKPLTGAGYPLPEDIYLSDHKLIHLGKHVKEYILQEQAYLKKGCTCAAVAGEMNMQPYILSAVINQVFKTNFNDFLNGYRVEYAKELIQNGEAKLHTLEALSEQCGFNNRNSFTLAFKKHTGQTPSCFIKQTQASAD